MATFSSKPGRTVSQRSHTLRKLVEKLLQEKGHDPNRLFCQHADIGPDRNSDIGRCEGDGEQYKCRVAVTATDKDTSELVLLRSYGTGKGKESEAYQCTMVEACIATSAAATFFESVKLEMCSKNLVDGGLRANNPINQAIEEISRNCGLEHKSVGCVLSIGTGKSDKTGVPDRPIPLVQKMAQLSLDSDHCASVFERSPVGYDLSETSESRHYFRFNVPLGSSNIKLDDAGSVSEMHELTDAYLGHIDSSDVEAGVSQCAKHLTNPPSNGVKLTLLSKRLKSHTVFHIPFLRNEMFTGRENCLKQINEATFNETAVEDPATTPFRKVVLTGLGGVGKTQLAIEFTYRARHENRDWSIFWISAVSEEAFQQSCWEIAKSCAISTSNQQDNIKQLVYQHLASEASEKWMLIVDNADDERFLSHPGEAVENLETHIPSKSGCRALFTTRNSKAANWIDGRVIHLDIMDEVEAREMLEKRVHETQLLDDAAAAAKLLTEIECLPLAIKQAAAYINETHVTITTYLTFLTNEKTDRDARALLSHGFRDDTKPSKANEGIAKTWIISMNYIEKYDPSASEILAFMSTVEPKSIPRWSLPLSAERSAVQNEYAIGTLKSFSFISEQKNSEFLNMHRLVHLAAKWWLQDQHMWIKTNEKAISHLECKAREVYEEQLHDHPANGSKICNLVPHITHLLIQNPPSVLDTFRRKDAMRWFREAHEYGERAFLLSHVLHKGFLDIQADFTESLCTNGRHEEAITLLESSPALSEHYLFFPTVRNSVLRSLADAYFYDGRIDRAVKIYEDLVKVTPDEQSQERVHLEMILAFFYVRINERQEAEAKLEHITSWLAEPDFASKTDEHFLRTKFASLLMAVGRLKQSIEQLRDFCVPRGVALFGPARPDTIAARMTLVHAYIQDEQWDQALDQAKEVIASLRDTPHIDSPELQVAQNVIEPLQLLLQTS
ncbi:MAG: hypothetical protein Q9162_002225 [Coniocarpon cinnabarinum]